MWESMLGHTCPSWRIEGRLWGEGCRRLVPPALLKCFLILSHAWGGAAWSYPSGCSCCCKRGKYRGTSADLKQSVTLSNQFLHFIRTFCSKNCRRSLKGWGRYSCGRIFQCKCDEVGNTTYDKFLLRDLLILITVPKPEFDIHRSLDLCTSYEAPSADSYSRTVLQSQYRWVGI